MRKPEKAYHVRLIPGQLLMLADTRSPFSPTENCCNARSNTLWPVSSSRSAKTVSQLSNSGICPARVSATAVGVLWLARARSLGCFNRIRTRCRSCSERANERPRDPLTVEARPADRTKSKVAHYGDVGPAETQNMSLLRAAIEALNDDEFQS